METGLGPSCEATYTSAKCAMYGKQSWGKWVWKSRDASFQLQNILEFADSQFLPACSGAMKGWWGLFFDCYSSYCLYFNIIYGFALKFLGVIQQTICRHQAYFQTDNIWNSFCIIAKGIVCNLNCFGSFALQSAWCLLKNYPLCDNVVCSLLQLGSNSKTEKQGI